MLSLPFAGLPNVLFNGLKMGWSGERAPHAAIRFVFVCFFFTPLIVVAKLDASDVQCVQYTIW